MNNNDGEGVDSGACRENHSFNAACRACMVTPSIRQQLGLVNWTVCWLYRLDYGASPACMLSISVPTEARVELDRLT